MYMYVYIYICHTIFTYTRIAICLHAYVVLHLNDEVIMQLLHRIWMLGFWLLQGAARPGLQVLGKLGRTRSLSGPP